MVAKDMQAREDSIELDQDALVAAKLDCQNRHNDFLAKIEKGVEVDIPGFELALDKAENVSAMYCMNPTYVRTFKYNKISQLQTEREDYLDLTPGTYCQDFLTDKAVYWTPPRDYPGRLIY